LHKLNGYSNYNYNIIVTELHTVTFEKQVWHFISTKPAGPPNITIHSWALSWQLFSVG